MAEAAAELRSAAVALEAADPASAVAAARRAVAAASDPVHAVKAHRLLGDAWLLAGDRAAARSALDEALRAAANLPPGNPGAVSVHNSLGVLEKFCGNLAAAAEHYGAALAGTTAQDREGRAALLHNLGGLAHSARDLPTAELHTRAALDLHTALAGPGSAQACADRGQLASIVSGLGRHDEAIGLLAETVAGFTARYSPAHVEVGIARCTLGAALHRAGRSVEAVAEYRAGLAIREAALGADHPDLAPTLLNLGRVLDRAGQRAEGGVLARRAVAVLAGKVVEDHRFLVAARRRAAEPDRP